MIRWNIHSKEERQRRIQSLSKSVMEFLARRRELIHQLQTLDGQLGHMRWERNALHNLDMPFNNIPEELLVMIFEAGMRLQGNSRHFGVLVSHVSHRWRHIALANPKLWNIVQCVVPADVDDEDYGQVVKRSRARAAAFLSRTISYHVSIGIEGFRNTSFPEAFVQLIGGHMNHCYSLYTRRVGNSGLQKLLGAISSKPTPILQIIDLLSDDTTYTELSEPLFPNTHCLNIAALHSFELVTIPHCLPAFRTITSLRLTDVWIDVDDLTGPFAFRDVLMALQFLDHLDLRLGCFNILPNYPPIVLPTIQTMHLDASACPGALGLFISLIQAASLNTLSLCAWGGVEVEEELDLANDLESHFPSLKHLIFGNVSTMVASFDIFAQKFPNIERLTCWSKCLVVCDIYHKLLHILNFVLDESDVTIDGRLRWAQLHTVGVFAPNLEGHDSNTLTQTTIQMLKSSMKLASNRVRKLKLPVSMTRTDSEVKIELRGLVEIEEISVDWPEHLGMCQCHSFICTI